VKAQETKLTNREITYSAGGIVWRENGEEREVLLILVRKWQNWMFPKGRVEQTDAGWHSAAQREVKEETGYDTLITDFAGVLKYTASSGAYKVVFLWHMTPVGESEFEPGDEIECYEWLTIREAIDRLTHDRDREFLKQFAFDHEI